jgi:hypothetical protein
MRKPTLYQRLKAKKRSQQLVVGVTWYNEETWAQVKATSADPKRFEASFPEWKAMATKARRDLQRSGIMALECLIVPEDFFAWCVLNNQENTAPSRAEYVSNVLSAAHASKE